MKCPNDGIPCAIDSCLHHGCREIRAVAGDIDSLEAYYVEVGRTSLGVPPRPLTPEEHMLVWNGLGVAGEGGEIADTIKKGVFHDQGIDDAKLKSEMGDVLWYLTAIARHRGFTLIDCMRANTAKLRARYPAGWDASRSHRPGTAPTEERTGTGDGHGNGSQKL